MHPLSSIRASSSDQRFDIRSSVAFGAPLVLIHGFLETPAVFDAFQARNTLLSARALRLRLPGHTPGHTPAETRASLRENAYLATYAERITATFDGAPVRIVAHSTGGLVALALAARYPNLVSDLMIMGALSSGRMDGHTSVSAYLSRVPFVGSGLFAAGLRYWLSTPERFRSGLASVVADPTRVPKVPDTMRREIAGCSPEVLREVLLWLLSYNLEATLPWITTPVLSVIGQHDRVVPPAHQISMLCKLPAGHAQLLNTGHLPFLEAPAQVDALFTSWLARPPLPDSATHRPTYRSHASGVQP